MSPNDDTPPASVIIPTYNRADLLRVNLAQFAGQSLERDRLEVVAADDGSHDGTRAAVEEFRDRLRLDSAALRPVPPWGRRRGVRRQRPGPWWPRTGRGPSARTGPRRRTGGETAGRAQQGRLQRLPWQGW
jgi:glycosyltransferase involved in cell wall biosynthesis